MRHATSTFFAQISPLVLLRPADRILVEAAADIGIAGLTSGYGASRGSQAPIGSSETSKARL